MKKKILILNGSPKKNGNTDTLVRWFVEGVSSKDAEIEIIHAARLKFKVGGCTSCRICQKIKRFECVINDDVKDVLKKMAKADIIVFATPLYFYASSAQLKLIIDRMFSLYKWNNKTDTFVSPMIGKTMGLIVSAYENIGLKVAEGSFKLTADYSGMRFKSFLVSNAGESGEVTRIKNIRDRTETFAKGLLKLAK
ncbi:MAG: flavodoxin family protein [Candidatus Omnitrophica bacterium]|nr:flavodoxin family protein [Candidatus Omnitrophota bacterium]